MAFWPGPTEFVELPAPPAPVICASRACELSTFACAAINVSSVLNCEAELPVPVVADPLVDEPVVDDAVVEDPVAVDPAPPVAFEVAVGAVVNVTVEPSA